MVRELRADKTEKRKPAAIVKSKKRKHDVDLTVINLISSDDGNDDDAPQPRKASSRRRISIEDSPEETRGGRVKEELTTYHAKNDSSRKQDDSKSSSSRGRRPTDLDKRNVYSARDIGRKRKRRDPSTDPIESDPRHEDRSRGIGKRMRRDPSPPSSESESRHGNASRGHRERNRRDSSSSPSESDSRHEDRPSPTSNRNRQRYLSPPQTAKRFKHPPILQEERYEDVPPSRQPLNDSRPSWFNPDKKSPKKPKQVPTLIVSNIPKDVGRLREPIEVDAPEIPDNLSGDEGDQESDPDLMFISHKPRQRR